VIADASGNVYVTGESAASASIITKDYDYLTIKYDSSGTEKWHKIYDGLAGGDDEATSMALDDSNNVYITGQCDNGSTGLINLDYVTIKYDTAGNQKWCAVYNGIGNGDDGAKAITVMNGSVFVAGGSWGIGTQKDLTVLKYLCVPTGINEYSLNQNEGFIVYPNPANDFLIIKNIMDNKPMIISISDFTGRNVVNITSAKNSETTIATRLLNQGIYFLNINNTYFKKIEILH
jgi:hypothetical protein